MKPHKLKKNHPISGGFLHVKGCYQQYATWLDVLVFALVSAVLQHVNDILLLPAHEPALYQLFTGHWVHLNWLHWFLNMAVFAFLPFLLPNIPRLLFWMLALVSPCLISLLLLHNQDLLQRQVHYYLGFSGALHGMYIFFASYYLWHGYLCKHSKASIVRHPVILWQSAIIWWGIILKILYEHFYTPIYTANMLGAPVIYEAHSYGAFVASMLFVLYVIFTQVVFFFKKQNKYKKIDTN